ncbi:MAG: DUF1343 domain-containing protein [Elusimicrobiota bacterium]
MRRAALAGLLFAPCLAWAGEKHAVLTGLDVLREGGAAVLKGKRVGLITNQTGVDREGRPAAHILEAAARVELKAMFSPEHGFTGVSEDSTVASGFYALPDGRRLPLYSLYGATRAPTADMLKGLDALVFDIQDVGVRFYTYAATMAMSMEAAAAAGLDFVVLDRPNPIDGDRVEGPLLDPEIRHFTAYLPVPVRHGLTMGELARLHNILGRIGARLQVVPLRGWARKMWFDETGLPWTPPSPNMPDLDSAVLYPGTGCFEATNLSVGRGTPLPFRWVGAPWLEPGPVLERLKSAKLQGVRFSAKALTPAKDVYEGLACPGIRIEVTDRGAMRPLEVFVHLAAALRDTQKGRFEVRGPAMSRLTGSRNFTELFGKGGKPEELLPLFDADAARFQTERAPFLLY